MDSMITQAPAQNNSAKYAFFYMLSLVSLIFMALSTGMVIFQIINKNIPDVANVFPGTYDSGALKFAISAIIIATPIYYWMMHLIQKSLRSAFLNKDAGVRKWLTYFIMLIAAIVMIGWLIATIYNFLDGELTTKFILKAITAIIIAGTVFSYYFYDIRRDGVGPEKDRTIAIFSYVSLAVVLISLVSSFFFVESPAQTRDRKEDAAVIANFNNIDNALNTYYYDNGKLPNELSVLINNPSNYYITDKDIKDPATGKQFDYKVMSKDTYQLCDTFKLSNKSQQDTNVYNDPRWQHDAGYQCISQKVRSDVKPGITPDGQPTVVPVPTRK